MQVSCKIVSWVHPHCVRFTVQHDARRIVFSNTAESKANLALLIVWKVQHDQLAVALTICDHREIVWCKVSKRKSTHHLHLHLCFRGR